MNHHPPPSKLLKFLPWVLLTPLYIMMAVVGYWALLSYVSNPLEVSAYSIVPPITRGMENIDLKRKDGFYMFKPGDKFAIQTLSKRNDECSIVITRYLRSIVGEPDGEYLLNSSTRNVKPTDRPIRIVNPLQIPYNVLPGKYILSSVISISCNPYQVYFPKYIVTTSIPILIEPMDQFNFESSDG